MPQKKKRAKTVQVGKYTLKPISTKELDDLLRKSKGDDEIARAWNLRLLPFLIKNYDELEKARKLWERIKRKKKPKNKSPFDFLFK